MRSVLAVALLIAFSIAFAIALLFLSAVNYVIGSGANLAVELTNNTYAQYYYGALNQYAPGLNTLVIATAVLLFILVLALLALSVP
jgi:hypothetical protein